MHVFVKIALLACVSLAAPASEGVEQLQAMMADPEQLQALMADPGFQAMQRQIAQPMQVMMAEAEQMEKALNDPKVRQQMERVTEPIKTLLSGPSVQEASKRVAEHLETVIADPTFQQEAQRMAEPLLAKFASADRRGVQEQMQTMMEDPSFKDLVTQVVEPINQIVSDGSFREQAKALGEEIKGVIADPKFQKQAQRVSAPIMSIMAEAQQMQEMLADPNFQQETGRIRQQSQQRKSLASFLLAANPSAIMSRRNPSIVQRVSVSNRFSNSRIKAMASNSEEWKKNTPGWENDSFQKPSEDDIIKKLEDMSEKYAMDPVQWIVAVTQTDATERPRTGKYDSNFQPGIYVDPVSREPLYSSDDKFNAGCGWPAFSKGIDEEAITEKVDNSHGMHRVEIRSKHGDSHLGHVFPDGPPEKGGMRHCVNSAATVFIPYEKMDEEGYSAYKEKVKNLSGK